MSAIAPAWDESGALAQFMQALGELKLAGRQQCLLIIDAARYDDFDVQRVLYTLDDNPQWGWLFDSTPFANNRDAGPVFVETSLGSPLSRHAAAHWADDGAVVVLVTQQSADSAMAGIRQSLKVHLPSYGPCLLRPYDGRFLEMLHTCLPEVLDSLVGQGDRLLWTIDHRTTVHWSSVQGRSAGVMGLQGHQGVPLERLLGWVAAWPRCTAITSHHGQTLRCTCQRIQTLWSEGHACPDTEAELATLWYFPEHIKKDFSDVRH